MELIEIIKWCYTEFTMRTLTDEEANCILEEILDNLGKKQYICTTLPLETMFNQLMFVIT